MGEDSTGGGEHTIQYTDDVLQNCTPKTYIILLASVTPMKSIKINHEKPISSVTGCLRKGVEVLNCKETQWSAVGY